jgi:hypothetical protein
MHSTRPVGWLALGIAAIAIGCGSKGSDLFGESQAASGGKAGSGHGGSEAGGSGGMGQGGNAQGGAGEGGSGGLDAGEQDVSQPDAAAGSGGGPIDCKDQCPKDCAQPGVNEPQCVQCVQATCGSDYQAMTQAAQYNEYVQCVQKCGHNTQCEGQCCNSNQTACTATIVFMGCMCGYQNKDCKPSCSALCGGGSFGDACVNCAIQSPCGRDIYAFMQSEGSGDYFPCAQGCGSDQECVDKCCTDWPQACSTRKETVDCICQ